jgi:hypothetical protein
MLESSDLDRLRQLVGAVSADEEPGVEIDRLESAVSRREVARRGLRRQIEHLRERIAGLEVEAATIDGEVLGLQRALEALYLDVAEHRGLDLNQWWSPIPIVGYRAWLIEEDGLHGARVRWTSRHLTAGCLGTSAESEVPHVRGECGSPPCGIYATKSLKTLFRFFGGGVVREVALGLVSLSGRVVDHDLGYRGARAQAVSLAVIRGQGLYLTDDPDEIDRLFTSTRDEIGLMCQPTKHPIEEALAYLEHQERRHQQWT